MTTPSKKSPRQLALELYQQQILSREELSADGMQGRAITAAVRSGSLLRLRRDHYARVGIGADVAEAVRIGGRVTCLTVMKLIGVFVLTAGGLHVHLAPRASRVRSRRASSTVLHWTIWSEEECPRHVAPLADAIRCAVRCQSPRAALATLDSLLHHRIVTETGLAEMFRLLPARFAPLLELVDGSAESGPETFMRLILRAMGVSFETQVFIPGVGRVDFVVDGWLIIECDSKEFHEGWDKQCDDRTRDLIAASLGYVTVRPIATDIFDRSDAVRDRLSAVIEALGPLLRPEMAS